jgi:hypothetical protein
MKKQYQLASDLILNPREGGKLSYCMNMYLWFNIFN